MTNAPATVSERSTARSSQREGIAFLGLPLIKCSWWIIAIGFGLWFGWISRNAINPDGISYLDIGDAWWHGDFRSAINPYWSPMYSWILGGALRLIKPSMMWE